MTSKLIKTSKLTFYVLLVGTIFFGVLPQPKVSAAADTVTLSTQKTILWNFSDCIVRYGERDSSIIDTHKGYFGGPDDPIGDWMDDSNYVVGFDLDSKNGTVSCLTIIQLGINALMDRGISIPQNMGRFDVEGNSTDIDKQKRAVSDWLGKYVINKTIADMRGAKVNYDRGEFEKKLRDLKSLSDTELTKIGPLSNAMIQRRYKDLFNMCYTSSTTSTDIIDEGKGDFKGSDGYFYYIKDRDQMQPDMLRFINDGGDNIKIGSNHSYTMDEIELKFYSFTDGFADAQVFNPYDSSGGSDFYPLGGDIVPFNEVGPGKGIADCGKIKDNKNVQDAILSQGIQIQSGKIEYTAVSPNAGLDESTTTSGAAAVEVEPSCETSGFELAWLTCGIINGLNGVVQGIFTGFIEPYLVTSPVNTEASADNPIFKAWSAMRSIANIILIFGLLFVVFGQAVGGGMIDAYTAKKIMPRILIAAILINISIYLVAALVDIFNILGAGIGNLFLAPFKDTIFDKFDGNSSGGNTLAVGAILAGAIVLIISYISISAFRNVDVGGGRAAGFSVAPFLHFLLVFILVPAVLITLAIFATLIIRQGLILILIVTAPIAFALFALPATEKYFTKWRETFVSTLMVYPIITVLFAVSIIMASISYNVGDSSDATFSSVMGAIVSFIILFVPLALIPFAFKLAGGLVGNILNASRGLGSKLSASPQNKYKENKAYERKLLYDRKMEDPNSSLNRRIAAKTQGRKIGADKRRDRISNVKNILSPKDEVVAFGEAYAGATARGVDANGANEAGEAARGSYRGHKRRLTDASGDLSPTNLLAARAGGAVAGAATAHGGYTPQQVTNASNSAVNAYQTSVTAGYSHNESTAAAIAAGDATLANRSQQAVSTSGRVAAEAYKRQAAAPSSLALTDDEKHTTASTAANAVGQTAANVYDESMRRSGGDAAAAGTDSNDASDSALTLFEVNRPTHSPEAAATAAIAVGDAYFGSSSPVGSPAHTFSVENAANAAANAHDNAVMAGTTDPAQARAAGRQAGQAHW